MKILIMINTVLAFLLMLLLSVLLFMIVIYLLYDGMEQEGVMITFNDCLFYFRNGLVFLLLF